MEKSYLFMKLLLKSHSPFIISPITQHGINSFLLVLHWATHLPFCGAPTTFLPVLWSNISRAGSMSYLCFYFQQHLAQTLAKKGKEERREKERKYFFKYLVYTKICARDFPIIILFNE